MAAGTCTGVAAALLFSVLGTGTIALLPHAARFLYWAYPVRHLGHGALYRYEVNASQNAAFYIFALLFFPLLGTGLAAWSGLVVAGRTGQRPDDGGGGHAPPRPDPPPPGSGRRHDHQPSGAACRSPHQAPSNGAPTGDRKKSTRCRAAPNGFPSPSAISAAAGC